MKKVHFTVEEINAIAIYHGKTRDVTIASMSNVSKYLNDKDMQRIMNQAVEKLRQITNEEYDAMQFIYTD